MFTIEVCENKKYKSVTLSRTRGEAFLRLSCLRLPNGRIKDSDGNIIAKRVNGKLSLV